MAAFVSASDGGKSGEAEGGLSAPPAAVSDDQTPPLTNRGCFMPSSPIHFHLDYLKLTLFVGYERVLEVVEGGLLERAGLPLGGWLDKGPADRWEHIYVGPGAVTLLVPKSSHVTYTIVELKGQACETVGAFAIKAFLAYLNAWDIRWHALRVDLAFDHVAFDPRTFDAAVAAGNFNSRALSVADRDWNENALGSTAYLGGRGQRKARRIRVYNKRGFNRCEAELRDVWAKSVVRQLADTPLEEWPRLAVGQLRGIADFIDRSADKRVDRCPLLPWWAEFVGNVERVTNLPEEDRRKNADDQKRYAIGVSEGHVQACARRLWATLMAFGPAYLAERIHFYADNTVTDEHRALAEQLKQYQYSGLAGLPIGDPEGDDHVPF
jgi:hypothetical protein